MYLIIITIFIQIFSQCSSNLLDSSACSIVCEPEEVQCAFDLKSHLYTIFSSKCAMAAHSACYGADLIQTPLKYCIKNQIATRRSYEEEVCPVFCPNHYAPVCGASKIRSYKYRTFNNGCFLDMLNCRGDEELASYVEVPLEFCQNHLMKNIFKEQVVASNLHEYEDYDY